MVDKWEPVPKNKAKGQLRTDTLAMLTHDIRNSLETILICTEMLLEGARERGAIEEEKILETIKSGAFTVDLLLTNYSYFSGNHLRPLILTKKPLAINSILHHIGQRYEIEARRRHLTLEVALQEGLPVVEGDPLGLERIFANLVHNALKFTPAPGWVTISSAQQRDEVVVTITDTGPGIAPQHAPFLFDQAMQYPAVDNTHPQRGSGLGLRIVQALVEAHGGRIKVDSLPSRGSCFSVFLPVVSGELTEA
jgi:signal transduction histidine kinase